MEVFQTSQFKKDLKKQKKRGKDIDRLKQVVRTISKEEKLEEKYRDHPLIGKWLGSRDCHIEPDWILIYRLESELLYLERTGTHSDLFK
jgi:mRNA interferase YafQ